MPLTNYVHVNVILAVSQTSRISCIAACVVIFMAIQSILPVSAQAAVVYEWSADCESGCTGTASGVLTLSDKYTPGDSFTKIEFVSWEYKSSSGMYVLTVDTPGPMLVGGQPPAVSGPPLDVTLFRHRPDKVPATYTQMGARGGAIPFDQGDTTGTIDLCSSPFRDTFRNGRFDLVPEPGSFPLLFDVLLTLLLFGGLLTLYFFFRGKEENEKTKS